MTKGIFFCINGIFDLLGKKYWVRNLGAIDYRNRIIQKS